jgi:uncharacterized membrane protein
MTDWEKTLSRWTAAGLIDPDTEARIRNFERKQAKSERLRWPVALALAVGGVLLGSGLLLFVSAHWDELGPSARMSIVVGAIALFHAGGALAADRFASLSTTLHALGTLALGGGIAMAGQIFNLEEHWSGGVMLWAIGAAIGWLLLRDWPQLTFLAILVPAWLMGEMDLWLDHRANGPVCVFALNTAFAYLSARHGAEAAEANLGRKALAWLGGLGLLPAAASAVFFDWSYNPPSGGLITAARMLSVAVPLGAAWLLRGRDVWMNAVAALWALGLILISQNKADLGVQAWCAIGSLGLVAWGLRDQRSERINLGMAGFAITVLFFYFSNIFDKLGRSASLVGLGLLFLAGGWALERVRRRLIARVRTEAERA